MHDLSKLAPSDSIDTSAAYARTHLFLASLSAILAQAPTNPAPAATGEKVTVTATPEPHCRWSWEAAEDLGTPLRLDSVSFYLLASPHAGQTLTPALASPKLVTVDRTSKEQTISDTANLTFMYGPAPEKADKSKRDTLYGFNACGAAKATGGKGIEFGKECPGGVEAYIKLLNYDKKDKGLSLFYTQTVVAGKDGPFIDWNCPNFFPKVTVKLQGQKLLD